MIKISECRCLLFQLFLLNLQRQNKIINLNSGGNTINTGTRKMKTSNFTEVLFNNVEKETEKAILVNMPVSWNDNTYARKFWFPKSCVKMYQQTMEIATWMVEKMEKENAIHGYMMSFAIAR